MSLTRCSVNALIGFRVADRCRPLIEPPKLTAWVADSSAYLLVSIRYSYIHAQERFFETFGFYEPVGSVKSSLSSGTISSSRRLLGLGL